LAFEHAAIFASLCRGREKTGTERVPRKIIHCEVRRERVTLDDDRNRFGAEALGSHTAAAMAGACDTPENRVIGDRAGFGRGHDDGEESAIAARRCAQNRQRAGLDACGLTASALVPTALTKVTPPAACRA